MKKKLFIFNIILFGIIGNVFGQQRVQSVSYLSSYVDRPVSLSTGVPNISVPIFELDTHSKNVKIQTSLNYNIENNKTEDVASEVGIGWALIGRGVILREIKNEADEIYYNAGAVFYTVNEFDDTYFYSLPNGISGKFRFLRNITNNTFSLVNLTENKVKIEYERESNTATLLVSSFTIIDDQGIKYVFNDFSQNREEEKSNDLIFKLCKSAFFLSKIMDTNNNDIVTYSYEKTNQYYAGSSTAVLSTTCKLKSIQPKNGGAIGFTYAKETPTEESLNDPDYITNISLSDPNGTLLFKYTFGYTTADFHYNYSTYNFGKYTKRVLTDIIKTDGNLQKIEKTTFSYSPNTRLLERIITPSNGVVQYEFENTDRFVDKESQFYINLITIANDYVDPDVQVVPLISQMPFDTHNSNLYYVNIEGDPNKAKTIYIHNEVTNYYPIPVDPLDPVDCMCKAPDGSWYINCDDCPSVPDQPNLEVNYQLKKGSQVYSDLTTVVPNKNWQRYTQIYPGLYTIQLSGTGGLGNLKVYELKFKDPPYKRSFLFNSYRIKEIKYFDTPNNTVPTKTKTYIYTDFSDNTKSSGYTFNYLDKPAGEQFILHKNVKILEKGIEGYSKYYFKTPDDYPKSTIAVGSTTDNTYSKYYISSMAGVMEKKEIYNSSDQLVASTKYETLFEELPNADYYNVYLGLYTKLAYTKSNKITEQQYEEGTTNYLQNITENTFNLHNYSISSSKNTSADGIVMETTYQYAVEKNNNKLIDANMLAVPIEVTQIQDGNVIGRIETLYNHPDNNFPSSVKSSGINGIQIGEENMDIYDSMGNLIQYSSKIGIPTTYIYGYNSTLPIAKIEGLKYADVLYVMGAQDNASLDIVKKSNQDVNSIDNGNEQLLRDALEVFRRKPEFKNYLITTYTYDPMIGVKSMTTPNGFTEYYYYDSQNRLIRVEDTNHNVIRENKYQQNVFQD